MVNHAILKENTKLIHNRLQDIADRNKKLTEENIKLYSVSWTTEDYKLPIAKEANYNFYVYAKERINESISLIDEIIKKETENAGSLDLTDTSLQNAVTYIDTLLLDFETTDTVNASQVQANVENFELLPAVYEPFIGDRQALLLLRGTLRKHKLYRNGTPLDKYIFDFAKGYEEIKDILDGMIVYIVNRTNDAPTSPLVIEGHLNDINNRIFQLADLLGVRFSDGEKSLNIDMDNYAKQIMGVPVTQYDGTIPKNKDNLTWEFKTVIR